MNTDAKNILPPNPIVLVPWQEARNRIGAMLAGVQKSAWFRDAAPEYSAACALAAALAAQREFLCAHNDEHFSVDVPWDTNTGLPSHPTLAADAISYAHRGLADDRTKALLTSFAEWAMYAKEEMRCACGGWTLRSVPLELWMNHSLDARADGLLVTQFVGVRTADKDHLAHHYAHKKPSRALGDLSIIWECKNLVRVNGVFAATPLGVERDELFNAERFVRQFSSTTGGETTNTTKEEAV